MRLWQVDILKAVAYAHNPSGRYYWTSVYYIDRDESPSDISCINDVREFEEISTTEDCLGWGYRVHEPPGRGNVIYNVVYPSGIPGLIDAVGAPQIINVARWSLYSATGRYSYRLNRQPLHAADIDGALLSPSGLSRQNASLNTFISLARYRNSYGELITRGEVVRPVTMWQMRHGTKRRRRNPLL